MKASTVIKVALDRIALCEQRLMSFQYAMGSSSAQGPQKGDDKLIGAKVLIYSSLQGDLLDAYRTLFMWGNVFQEAREIAKEKAMRHFLGEGKSIMQYLNLDGQMPNMWYGEDEDKFRKLIREASTDETRLL